MLDPRATEGSSQPAPGIGRAYLHTGVSLMDMLVILIVLLLLFGGGGGLYWGLGSGWGVGPIGLIIVVLVVAFLLNGRRRL
ncbi:MAG: hypothetical protein NVS9B10_02770 [Nevskia sp.]